MFKLFISLLVIYLIWQLYKIIFKKYPNEEKLFLVCFSLFLFCSGYFICILIYPDFCKYANEWFDLRASFYGMFLASSAYSSKLPVIEKYRKITSFLINITISCAFSDIIDRVAFDPTKIGINDIITVLIFSFISYKLVYARKI